MSEGTASFLLAVLGLAFGVGGILLIYLLGGWIGISFGILGIILGIYLGLWAGLLGEFSGPDNKPFRFNELFKIK